MIKAIEALYKNPQFNVNIEGTKSNWYKQETGIRQGCLLSPYLFILVMTVMFRDVHDGMRTDRGKLDGLDFTELLYADDTAIITNNTSTMNRILEKIEDCATHFGLSFNKTKCIAMNYNSKGTTKYKDGTKVPTADETVYLGATISKTHNTRKEVATKISQCMVILKKLDNFWNNHNCNNKFKIQVFDAVIRSKLVYSMESLEIPQGVLSKMNTFQLKGLRKILKLQTTYMDRANTNHRIFEEINKTHNPKRATDRNMRTYSEYVHSAQNKLLAHTVRAANDDPLRQCTLKPNTHEPITLDRKRVGRPRQNWTRSTFERLAIKNLGTSKALFRTCPYQYMDILAPKIIDRSIRT